MNLKRHERLLHVNAMSQTEGKENLQIKVFCVEYSGYPIAKAGLVFNRLLNWPFDGPFYYCFEKLFLP